MKRVYGVQTNNEVLIHFTQSEESSSRKLDHGVPVNLNRSGWWMQASSNPSTPLCTKPICVIEPSNLQILPWYSVIGFFYFDLKPQHLFWLYTTQRISFRIKGPSKHMAWVRWNKLLAKKDKGGWGVGTLFFCLQGLCSPNGFGDSKWRMITCELV